MGGCMPQAQKAARQRLLACNKRTVAAGHIDPGEGAVGVAQGTRAIWAILRQGSRTCCTAGCASGAGALANVRVVLVCI